MDREKLSATFLRQAISLGTQMAESEALAMLALKTRHAARNSPNVVVGPTKVSGGDVARVIKLPNGGGRLEIWEYGKGWVDGVGKVTPDELMPGAGKPVSAADAARLAIPASEL